MEDDSTLKQPQTPRQDAKEDEKDDETVPQLSPPPVKATQALSDVSYTDT